MIGPSACPRCGSAEVTVLAGNYLYYVHCHHCKHESKATYKSASEAVLAWNEKEEFVNEEGN